MKGYTDIEQSCNLAEILPIESADMWYHGHYSPWKSERKYENEPCPFHSVSPNWDKPCWSLAALIGVLPKEIEIEGQCYAPCLFPTGNKWLLKLWYDSNYIFTSPIVVFSNNPINAYYEFILKLHEQNLL